MAKHILVILLSSYLVFNFGISFAAPNDDVEDTKEFHEASYEISQCLKRLIAVEFFCVQIDDNAKSDQDGNDSFIRSPGNLGLEKTLDLFYEIINKMENNIKQFINTSLTRINQTVSFIRTFASEQFNKGTSGNLRLLARKKRSSLLPIVEKVTQFIPTNFFKNEVRTQRSVGNLQESAHAVGFEDSQSEVPYSLHSISELRRKGEILEAYVDAGSRRVKQQKGTRINPVYRTPTTPTSVTLPVPLTPQETLENVMETSETVTSIVNKFIEVIDSIKRVLEIFTTRRKRENFETLRSSLEGFLDKFVYQIKRILNNCRKLDFYPITEEIRKRRDLYTSGYPNVPTRKRFLAQTVNNYLQKVSAARDMPNRREFKSTTRIRNPEESGGSNLTSLLQLPQNIVRGAFNISRNAIKSAFKLILSAREEP